MIRPEKCCRLRSLSAIADGFARMIFIVPLVMMRVEYLKVDRGQLVY
jgi:hypothetical protein